MTEKLNGNVFMFKLEECGGDVMSLFDDCDTIVYCHFRNKEIFIIIIRY